MAEYLTPGAYVERADATVPSIAGLRTDIAGFVGIAESGPLDTPVPVESFRQFQSHFGNFIGGAYLTYVVRAFFENGGRRCWVIRVASKDRNNGAAVSSVTLQDNSVPTPINEWVIKAASPGVWGNDLSVAVRSQSLHETVSYPGMYSGRYATVESVAGFNRGSLIRISQTNAEEKWRVISCVDGARKRIYWKHPEPGAGLTYDRPVSGFNLDQLLYISELTYAVDVWRSGKFIDRYAGLSLVAEHPAYGPKVLSEPEYPSTLDAENKLPPTPPFIFIEARNTPAGVIPQPLEITDGVNLPLTGGADGLAFLRVEDFMGMPIDPLDSDTVKDQKRRGIRALELIDEIAIVAVPDILIRPEKDPEYEVVRRPVADPCISCPPPPEQVAPPNQPKGRNELPPTFSEDEIYQVQAALIQHCEQRRDRFALIDSPFNLAQNDVSGFGAVQAWRARFETQYAALYYPWVLVVDPLSTQLVRQIPACGHVAGQYALHDIEIGVHKAPANRLLNWLQDLSNVVSFEQQGALNPLGINVIRADAGRGFRIMGARTLSSDPDWRYVNVRRLIMMVMKAIELSIQWAAFEPNNAATRTKIGLALSELMTALWKRGALSGDFTEQAFSVKCDESNNPPAQRANGLLIAEVGIAPSNPFEFVILRVGRQENSFEVVELVDFPRAA